MASKPMNIIHEDHLDSSDYSHKHVYNEAQKIREERMLVNRRGIMTH